MKIKQLWESIAENQKDAELKGGENMEQLGEKRLKEVYEIIEELDGLDEWEVEELKGVIRYMLDLHRRLGGSKEK